MRFPSRMQYDLTADVKAQKETDILCLDESLTVQSAAQDCDINVLVRRFGLDRRGSPPQAVDPTWFGDFSETPKDLQSAIHLVRDAQAKFDALPPDLRGRFRNDPAELWEFVNDGRNGAEAVTLGLLKAPPEPVAAPVPVVPAEEPVSKSV